MRMPAGLPPEGLFEQAGTAAGQGLGRTAGGGLGLVAPSGAGPDRAPPARAPRLRVQHLRLEFAPRARRFSRLGAGMLLLSVGALGVSAMHLFNQLTDNARLADKVAALEARRGAATAGAPRTSAPDAADQARLRAARQVAESLVTPWADLLEALESVPMQKVAVLSIEPSVSKRSVRLTAEARDAQHMLAYLGALQREPRLSSVVLVSHQVQAQASGTPVRFQLQASWGTGQ